MELRRYWRIIWRRWWLVAALVGIVLVISLVTYRPPMPVYQVTMRFAIGIEGVEPVNATSGEGRSDVWLASEYLADDLSGVLKGGDFAARIGEQMGMIVMVTARNQGTRDAAMVPIRVENEAGRQITDAIPLVQGEGLGVAAIRAGYLWIPGATLTFTINPEDAEGGYPEANRDDNVATFVVP